MPAKAYNIGQSQTRMFSNVRRLPRIRNRVGSQTALIRDGKRAGVERRKAKTGGSGG